jgi:hypothetical protein
VSRGRVVIALLLAALTAALVITEITEKPFRGFWIDHPITAALVASGVLLAATYLVFDDIVRRREAKREERLAVAAAISNIQVAAWRFRAEIEIRFLDFSRDVLRSFEIIHDKSIWPIVPTEEFRRYNAGARCLADHVVTTARGRVELLREITVASQLLDRETKLRGALLRSVLLVPPIERLDSLYGAVDQLVLQLAAAFRGFENANAYGAAEALIAYNEVLTLMSDRLAS